MKNKNLIPVYFLYFVISGLLLFVSSCSDDVIKPIEPEVNETDTIHLFNFRADTVESGLMPQFCASDTNNVFLPSNLPHYHYTNLKYNTVPYTDPDFSQSTSAAYNKDNVFFGGTNNSAGCMLMKLEGGKIINYRIPGDSNFLVNNILTLGENELWMGTLKNVVYYFNSGVFTKYFLDSAVYNGFFFKANGEVFVLATEYSNGEIVVNKTYKFTGHGFTAVASDSGDYIESFISRCGDDAIRISESSLYYFNGSNWQILYNTPFRTRYVSGASKENMLCYGTDFVTIKRGFYIRKDNKWYLETAEAPINIQYLPYCTPIQYSQGRYYMICEPAYEFYTCLLQLMPIQ